MSKISVDLIPIAAGNGCRANFPSMYASQVCRMPQYVTFILVRLLAVLLDQQAQGADPHQHFFSVLLVLFKKPKQKLHLTFSSHRAVWVLQGALEFTS